MIARGNQDGLSVRLLDEVKNRLEGLVVLKYLTDLSSRVIDVTGMVNSAALNHEEETLVAVLGSLIKRRKRRRSHLAQTGVHIRHVAAVDLEGNVRSRKQTQLRQRNVLAQSKGIETGAVINIVPSVLLLSELGNVDIILSAAARGALRQEVASAAAQHEINNATKRTMANLVQRNLIALHAMEDVSSEASRSGVRDIGSHHQASVVSSALGSLENGTAGLVIGEHRNSAIVALEAAREGRSAGSGVGHQAVARARAGGTPEVTVEGEGIVDRQVLGELAERARKRERGGPHAIGHHEDQVALATGRR